MLLLFVLQLPHALSVHFRSVVPQRPPGEQAVQDSLHTGIIIVKVASLMLGFTLSPVFAFEDSAQLPLGVNATVRDQ